jgi:hypothetical protein
MDVFSFHSNQSICAYKNIGDNFGNNQILPKNKLQYWSVLGEKLRIRKIPQLSRKKQKNEWEQ